MKATDLVLARYMNGSTAKAYGVYAKKKRTTPETVELKDGAKGHWIGKKDAKNVLIYYHGTTTRS